MVIVGASIGAIVQSILPEPVLLIVQTISFTFYSVILGIKLIKLCKAESQQKYYNTIETNKDVTLDQNVSESLMIRKEP